MPRLIQNWSSKSADNNGIECKWALLVTGSAHLALVVRSIYARAVSGSIISRDFGFDGQNRTQEIGKVWYLAIVVIDKIAVKKYGEE